MITPQTFGRRTDDITVVQWPTGSNGSEEYDYFVDDLGPSWTVTLETWRTISCTDGTNEFSIDRGGCAAKGADNNWQKISPETLKLFFQPV